MRRYEQDVDAIIHRSSSRTPEFRLWLAVLVNAFFSYKMFHHGPGREFLFDPDNYFFCEVCEELGFDPEAMRERIRRARMPQDRRSPAGQGDG